MNFLHDIHPHEHSNHKSSSFIYDFTGIFSHNHDEPDSEHDDNQTDKHPFPHTHLLQGHTLVQTISTVVVKFATGLDYIICCRFEPTNIADVTKSTYLIDKLIYYESAWGTKMMLRAPPHIFKSYFS